MVHSSCTFASTRKAALPLSLPIVSASVHARRDAARSLAEDNWDNEGGHLPGVNRLPAPLASSASEVESLATRVRLMASTLSSDFANGRVGTRYNTYAHRARVLRQQKAKLDAMRASFRMQRY